MAKTISDEVMKFSLEINGDPAQKELAKLTSTNSDLKKILKELNAEEVQRKKALAKLTEEYGRNAKLAGECEAQGKKLYATYQTEKVKLESLATQYGKNSLEYKNQKRNVDSLLNSSIKQESNVENLTAKNLKLSPTIDKLSLEYKTLKDRIKGLNVDIDANGVKIAGLQDKIGITALTMDQLRKKATALSIVLNHLVPNTADHIRYTAELDEVNKRLTELKGKSNSAKSSIGSLADTFNRYQGMALAAVAALTGFAISIQKIIDINGKLSDAQSNVMKTTGMTKIEVDELTKSFGLLQTRTSRIDLLGIAEQGGRIGIAKAEIGDFVNVMNKANVSLGDSFTGGAEEVANKLGKIKFLFEQTKGMNVEEAYNSIGSAINDLGANGTASEANIADFTTRIGSLTDVLKPTIEETLALGTAFEESGIESEVSARAYGIFMKQASTETAKFAKVMGITQGEVESMINTNPLEFMLKFSEGMKGMNATDTAKTLDELGISADGANKVIGAMGNNTNRFRELIDLSNNSFATGTSLINEYDIKNNNLAATLEKISKTVSGWFSSESFIKWLGASVEWLAKFIGATEDAEGSVTAWKNTLVFIAKVLAIVTAAMVTNLGWQKLVALWTTRSAEANILYIIAAKARAFADGVGTVATQAYAIATMLMRGNLVGATTAFRAMTVAMMTTPWGFLLGAIAAIGTAYVLFSDEAKVAETAQSLLNQTIKETDSVVNQQTASMRTLLAVAQDETASKEARLAAIKKLNEISPEYLKTLTLENINTAKGKQLIDAYVKSLEKKAMLQILQKRQASIMEDMDKRKNMSLEEEVSWYDEAWSSIKNFNNASLAAADIALTATQRRTKGLSELQAKLNLTNAEMEAFLKKNPSVIVDIETNVTGGGSTYTPPAGIGTGGGTGAKKNPNSSQAEINKLKLDEQSKFNDLFLKQQRQLEDDKIAAMVDGYEKEILIENQRYKREIDDLNRQKVHADELAKLDEDIAKAKEAKDMTKYNALLIIRKGWDKKNLDLDTQINEIKEGKLAAHNIKLGIIQEKAAKESIEKSKEVFDQDKILRETKFNEELAKLGNNEKAKAKLKKDFEANELVEEEKFLNDLINKFNLVVGKGKIEGVDLSLLTPEQVASFTAEAAKVGLTLAQLIAKKNELAGKTTGTDFGILQGAGTDIFGFSPKQWSNAFNNFDTLEEKIEAAQVVFGGLQNAWSMYSNFVDANSKRELQSLDKKQTTERTKLKQQLDTKRISQEQYDKKIKKLDDDKEKAQAKADYKRAKNEKIAALFSIATNTAIGVMKAVAASPLTGGLPWSAIIGGMGLLQAGLVLATPLPAKGYESGLYPEFVKREQDGKMFKSKYAGKTRSGLVSETSHFLVAENGPEMVIDNKAWRQMDPAVKDALVRNLQGIKGFENGKYNTEKMRYEVPATSSAPASSANDNQLLEMLMMVVSENTTVMKQLQENGVFVTNKDLKSMKNLKEGIEAFDQLKSKSKFK